MGKPQENNLPDEDAARSSPGEKAQPVTQEMLADAFDRVRERANAGDAHSREFLKKYLDQHPQLWSHFGSMAAHAEHSLVSAISSKWFTATTIRHEAARMRRDLAGPHPTALEQMAVQRIVLCWLQLCHTEIRFSESQADLSWARYWLRRVEVADKLYRSAVGSLMAIRELQASDKNLARPAIRDSRPPEQGESVSCDGSPASAAETAVVQLGKNRIREVENALANRPACSPPGMNGHHHRLEELLAKPST